LRTTCLLILSMLFPVFACATINRMFTNRTFRKGGYDIYSPQAEFTFQKKPLRRVLTVPDPDGYKDRTYIETTGDPDVDQIRFRGETYKRSEQGTEEMFDRADRVWREKLALLKVRKVHQQWVRKNPSERAETRGYFH